MCQLWVNLPAAVKMSPAAYQPILATNIKTSPLHVWQGSEVAADLKPQMVGIGDEEEVPAGTLVVIKDLASRPELNGRLGRVVVGSESERCKQRRCRGIH